MQQNEPLNYIDGLPVFAGDLKKNDALFIQGAMHLCKPYVFTYVQSGCEVVHGPSCCIPEEIHVDKCSVDGIPVIARRGGGGTVVLSDGMCIIIVVGERRGRYALPIFNDIHSAMIRLLENTGVTSIAKKGISDIAIDNKKILGSSLYLGTHPELYYYQSSLMVSSDPALIDRYLKYPPREPEYRCKRAHAAFCTTLNKEGCYLTAEKVAEIFRNELPALIDKKEK